MTHARRPLALVMGGSAIALAALVAAGGRGLATPPLASWTAAEAWFEQSGPTAAVLAGLRLAAIAGAAWLLLAAALQLLAGLAPWRTLQRLADAVSPAALRGLSCSLTGLCVGAGLLGSPPVSVARVDPPGTAVMEVLDPAEPTITEPAVTRPPATTTSTATTTLTTTVAPPGDRPAAVPAPVVSPDDEVVVAVGDSFWSLAEDAIADHPHPPAVEEYWRRLIAANRGRLVVPANPDLLYPGQVLTLPPIDD